MKTVLTQEKEIKETITYFRSLLSKEADENTLALWHFPHGEQGDFETFSLVTDIGRLFVGIPSRWNCRMPHLFCLQKEIGNLSPNVELNIPLGLDRTVSGLFVKNESEIYLCSRGKFTSFRGAIKKDLAFEYFKKRLITVSDGYDDNQVILISCLADINLVGNLAQYVKDVITFKETVKEMNK